MSVYIGTCVLKKFKGVIEMQKNIKTVLYGLGMTASTFMVGFLIGYAGFCEPNGNQCNSSGTNGLIGGSATTLLSFVCVGGLFAVSKIYKKTMSSEKEPLLPVYVENEKSKDTSKEVIINLPVGLPV